MDRRKEDALIGGDPGMSVMVTREVSRGHSSYGNEPTTLKDSRRFHQSSEGLNIKLFQMRQGAYTIVVYAFNSSLVASL